jgi:hypothetical protein
MSNWKNRPQEEANLLNPAFCCAIVSSSIISFKDKDGAGMPLPLVHLLLPILLHKKTREALPPNTRTTLAAWTQENTDLRISFPFRVKSLKNYTQEAILFGIEQEWLKFQEDYSIDTTKDNRQTEKLLRKLKGEPRDCILRSRFLGKWFAKSGSTQTIMALWGVKP